jgi:glycosyltransferase involved in cell wall biosynthesis
MRSVEREGLKESVFLTGYVDDETLAAMYNAAVGVLYPSHEEGFGLPPLEAMACGTPVAASNVGAIRETLGDAALLIAPSDVQGWVAAFSKLSASEEQSQIARDRRIQFANRFSWGKCAKAVRAVYEEIMEQSHSRKSGYFVSSH